MNLPKLSKASGEKSAGAVRADHLANAILQDRAAAWKSVVWCPGAGSNHRHCDFQSHALPTELPGHTSGAEKAAASGRFIERSERRVHPPSPKASARRARPAHFPQLVGKSWLFRVLGVVLAAGNDIAAGQPAVEVDVAAARRAERAEGLLDGLAADRASARGGWGRSGLIGHGWDGVYIICRMFRCAPPLLAGGAIASASSPAAQVLGLVARDGDLARKRRAIASKRGASSAISE